jgi:hypothetical protein
MQIHRKHLPSSKKICDASNDKHTAETETARRLLTMGPLHAATSQKNVIIETWHGPFEASFISRGFSMCSLLQLVQLLKMRDPDSALTSSRLSSNEDLSTS